MKYALTFCAGFALALTGVYTLDNYTWSRTLLSVGCVWNGDIGIWSPDSNRRVCVDESTTYDADVAFQRVLETLEFLEAYSL